VVLTGRLGLCINDHMPVHSPEIDDYWGSRDALDDCWKTGDYHFLRYDHGWGGWGGHVPTVGGDSVLVSGRYKLY
jgi:hypothetical protein